MDGNIYASLSRNLAFGIGNFWDPSLSEYFGKEFHDHPPLAFGLQALFFKLIGDYFWVEKLYSIFILIGHLFLIKAFWKEIFPNSKKNLWLLFILYALVPTISWSFSNNMLENTMALFSGMAIFILFKNRQQFKWWPLLLAAFFVVCAFHTKGPVSLFPLATPFFLFLCFKEISFWKMLLQSIALLAFSLGIFALVHFSSVEAAESWTIYFNKQVLGTITAENPSYGVRRSFILERLILEIIIPLVLALIYLIISKTKKLKINFQTAFISFFIFSGLSAILPIMISPKQWSFYTVPSILYLVIALAIIIVQISSKLQKSLKQRHFKWINGMGLAGIIIVFIISLNSFGELSRDKGKLGGIMEICEILPKNSLVSADPIYSNDWNLNTYFIRYNYISLDYNNLEREFFVGDRNSKVDTSYQLVYQKEGEELVLFKRNQRDANK